MKIKKQWLIIITAITCAFLLMTGSSLGRVIKKEGRTYIVDQLGEYWDVTQAESLGFDPEKFQYGIGRNTFTTLDDAHLKTPEYLFDSHRVIGVAKNGQAHAYSVSKLARHEIANTTLGDSAVAGAY